MPQSPTDLMHLALQVASSGFADELPIAAVISNPSGLVIASSKNAVFEKEQHLAHAEMLAIAGIGLTTLKREAECMTIAVTLEPCPMCAWAIRSAGIGRLVFGAYNPLYGAAGSVYDLLRDGRHGRRVEVVGGVLEEDCKRLLGNAFLDIRNNEEW